MPVDVYRVPVPKARLSIPFFIDDSEFAQMAAQGRGPEPDSDAKQ